MVHQPLLHKVTPPHPHRVAVRVPLIALDSLWILPTVFKKVVYTCCPKVAHDAAAFYVRPH